MHKPIPKWLVGLLVANGLWLLVRGTDFQAILGAASLGLLVMGLRIERPHE